MKTASLAVTTGTTIFITTLLGVILGYCLYGRFTSAQIIITVASLLLIIILVKNTVWNKRNIKYVTIPFSLGIIIFSISFLHAQSVLTDRETSCETVQKSPDKATLVRVINQQRRNNETTVLRLRSHDNKLQAYAKATIPSWVSIRYNDVIDISTARSHQTITCLFDRREWFSYNNYLLLKKIYIQYSFTAPPKVYYNYSQHNFLSSTGPYTDQLIRMTTWYEARVGDLLPNQLGALVIGMTSGNDLNFTDRSEELFNTLGLTHIVVLSGYNISLIIDAIRSLNRKLLTRRTTLSIGLIVAFMFVLSVGFSAPLVRALIMAVLGGAAQFWYRSVTTLRLIALTMILVALISPLTMLFDLSFLLSISALIGICTVYPSILYILNPLLQRMRSSMRSVLQILLLTVAVQIATTPLIMILSDRISLIAPLANMIVAPFLPILMSCGPGIILLSLIDPLLGDYGTRSINQIGITLFTVGEKLSHLPYSEMLLTPSTKIIIAGCTLGIMIVSLFAHARIDARTLTNQDYS